MLDLPFDDPFSKDDDDNPTIRFTRVMRTPHSEQYVLWEGKTRIGQVDIHYNMDIIHGTLVVERAFSESAMSAIIGQIDAEIVSSYMPPFERENFLLTIFQGKELEPYADGEPDIDDEEEDF